MGYGTPIGIFFDLSGNTRPEGGDPGSEDNPDRGCFEFVYAPTGYSHGVLGVASGDIVKVIGVAAADIVKVTGV